METVSGSRRNKRRVPLATGGRYGGASTLIGIVLSQFKRLLLSKRVYLQCTSIAIKLHWEEDSEGQKVLIKICFWRTLIAIWLSNSSFGTSNQSWLKLYILHSQLFILWFHVRHLQIQLSVKCVPVSWSAVGSSHSVGGRSVHSLGRPHDSSTGRLSAGSCELWCIHFLVLLCLQILQNFATFNLDTVYIAGDFRGAKYSWFSWLNTGPRIFYPRMKRPNLPLPAVQAATTKI